MKSLKPKIKLIDGPARITVIIVTGSLYVGIALTSLLFIHDIGSGITPRLRAWIGCLAIIYLYIALICAKKGKISTANWLLIGFYELLTGTVLLSWGLESMVGILTAGFTLLLPGILLAPRHIFGVALTIISIVITTFVLHSTQLITPIPYPTKSASSILDVIAYSTILAVFALVSWVSSYQSSQSLRRAHKAERTIREQKDMLAIELERQSAQLREAQLQQIQQLYKFALIGQSAAMTLHELSNHLSVLNLDIGDLKQQHKHSKSIKNAEESMDHINRMVRKVRAQLNSQNIVQDFAPSSALAQITKDLAQKFDDRHVRLLAKGILEGKKIKGDASIFMQIISTLLNNALDSCLEIPNATVTISTAVSSNRAVIQVSDNGPGIDELIKPLLFQPIESSKSSGLGVGLYIANHLVESQLKGTLRLLKSKSGANFQLTLPLKR